MMYYRDKNTLITIIALPLSNFLKKPLFPQLPKSGGWFQSSAGEEEILFCLSTKLGRCDK